MPPKGSKRPIRRSPEDQFEESNVRSTSGRRGAAQPSVNERGYRKQGNKAPGRHSRDSDDQQTIDDDHDNRGHTSTNDENEGDEPTNDEEDDELPDYEEDDDEQPPDLKRELKQPRKDKEDIQQPDDREKQLGQAIQTVITHLTRGDELDFTVTWDFKNSQVTTRVGLGADSSVEPDKKLPPGWKWVLGKHLPTEEERVEALVQTVKDKIKKALLRQADLKRKNADTDSNNERLRKRVRNEDEDE